MPVFAALAGGKVPLYRPLRAPAGGKVALAGGKVLYRPLELLYHPLEKNLWPTFFCFRKTRETTQTTPNFMQSSFLRSKLVNSHFLN
jgi:hypothetical protein